MCFWKFKVQIWTFNSEKTKKLFKMIIEITLQIMSDKDIKIEELKKLVDEIEVTLHDGKKQISEKQILLLKKILEISKFFTSKT